jgi:aspartate kinase
MGGTTALLLDRVKSFTTSLADKECDVALSSGEQVSAALLSLALRQLGINASSFLGWQIPIFTSPFFSSADIECVGTDKIRQVLSWGGVPVVAGFQGVTADNAITTLGRGGSDATAVAISFAISADECLIYTDVDGVYSADPRVVLGAERLSQISYAEMLELSSNGAKVLQSRSVMIAASCSVRLRVLSSFSEEGGTEVMESVSIPKNKRITGIAHSISHFKTTVFDKDLNIAKLLSLLSDKLVIDMLAISAESDRRFLSFIALKTSQNDIKEILIDYKDVILDEDIGIITLVGTGIKTDHNICRDIFDLLSGDGILIKQVVMSETTLQMIVPTMQIERGIAIVHKHFFPGNAKTTASE